MKTAIVALSGGIDSSTVLAEAWDQNRMVVQAISFKYPSKHNDAELLAAASVSLYYDTQWQFVDLSGVFTGFKSALLNTGGDLPHGHYEAESMRQTVVPGRNLIFASVLAGLAESVGADEVWLGIHAGDHFIYPDCRPDFLTALQMAVHLSSDKKVMVKAPFIDVPKSAIITRGVQLNVPFKLTRTCYSDKAVACGKCGSCQERLASFAVLGLNDPIEYETRELLPKAGAD